MKLDTFKFRSRGKGVKGQTFEAAIIGKPVIGDDGCVDDVEFKTDELPTELEFKSILESMNFDYRECLARGFNSMSKAAASTGGQASIVTSWIYRDKLVTGNDDADKIQVRAIVGAVLNLRKALNKELLESYDLYKTLNAAK